MTHKLKDTALSLFGTSVTVSPSPILIVIASSSAARLAQGNLRNVYLLGQQLRIPHHRLPAGRFPPWNFCVLTTNLLRRARSHRHETHTVLSSTGP
jgi:hypothetical protein